MNGQTLTAEHIRQAKEVLNNSPAIPFIIKVVRAAGTWYANGYRIDEETLAYLLEHSIVTWS